MEFTHKPVLVKEVLQGLAIKPDGYYIDATFGRGGHSLNILKQLGPEGRLMALDKDPDAVKVAKEGPFRDKRFSITQASFADLEEVVQEQGWHGKVNGILLDLGVSSPQLEDPKRGFSFTREGPLDMRMNPKEGMDAATWINQASSTEISRVLWNYGEERFARRIADAIVQEREEKPIETTLQLAKLIEQVLPYYEGQKHPATRSFQAIRIFINHELKDLKACLPQCVAMMSVGGRICVISFHSLEDRIVKRFIRHEAQGGHPPDLPLREDEIKRSLRKVGGLIKPQPAEIADNPRARSARLRIAEKIA